MESESRDQVEGATYGELSAFPLAGGEQLNGVRWKRLLPRRSLRVLLVEHDDSTRHIVAALQRKCSYRVAAVADGLKAWEMMTEKSYIFDLVLTEVETPLLSGIDFLTKIIGAEDYKKIPVIMMSTKDSVGIVLKCMLKGAADFLVKPVRKNELRNLWQHVWRKYCSNSCAHALNFNAASNHVSSNGGGISQTGENSEEISDAQIHDQCLGRKSDAELDVAQEQAEPSLTKIGCLIRKRKARPGLPGNSLTALASSSMKTDAAGLIEKNLEARDFEGLPIQVANALDNTRLCLRSGKSDAVKPSSHCEIRVQQNAALSISGCHDPLANGQISRAVMKMSVLDEHQSPKAVGSSQTKLASISSTLPMWDLSFRRVQSSDGEQRQIKERHILNHSNASAFTRYCSKDRNRTCQISSSSNVCFRSAECIDRSQPRNGHGGGTNSGSNSLFYCITPVASQQDLFGTSGREDNVVHFSQLGFAPIPIHVGAIPCPSSQVDYGMMLKPIFSQDGCSVPWSTNATDKGQFQVFSFQTGNHEDDFSSHTRPVIYHCDDLNHPLPCGGKVNEREAVQPRDMLSKHTGQVYQPGRCNSDILEGCGINYRRDTTEAAKAAGTVIELGNGCVENLNKKGANSNRSFREAALMKFLLKKKDRCFEKKVRYLSRKMLAEQRPRVKGQFVRQKFPEPNTALNANG